MATKYYKARVIRSEVGANSLRCMGCRVASHDTIAREYPRVPPAPTSRPQCDRCGTSLPQVELAAKGMC